MSTIAERLAVFAGDPGNEPCADPWRPGRLCRAWMVDVAPADRVAVGVARGHFGAPTAAVDLDDVEDGVER